MKAFKRFVQEAKRPPHNVWTSGLCCPFANALHQEFKLDIWAVVERATKDGAEDLIHAFVRKGDLAIDARGIHPIQNLVQSVSRHKMWPGEDSEYLLKSFTPEELQSKTVEDVEDTEEALQYIRAHPDLFRGLR